MRFSAFGLCGPSSPRIHFDAGSSSPSLLERLNQKLLELSIGQRIRSQVKTLARIHDLENSERHPATQTLAHLVKAKRLSQRPQAVAVVRNRLGREIVTQVRRKQRPI